MKKLRLLQDRLGKRSLNFFVIVFCFCGGLLFALLFCVFLVYYLRCKISGFLFKMQVSKYKGLFAEWLYC